ncbi:hypothetical protein AB0C90_39770 [Streptomyces sp. NPDC048550]|uniref:hypothetical protein n=1 Tax=Streptomyces sp. NPDC048550 TaxID=3155739 RepID=UPI00344039B3
MPTAATALAVLPRSLPTRAAAPPAAPDHRPPTGPDDTDTDTDTDAGQEPVIDLNAVRAREKSRTDVEAMDFTVE